MHWVLQNNIFPRLAERSHGSILSGFAGGRNTFLVGFGSHAGGDQDNRQANQAYGQEDEFGLKLDQVL